MIMSTPTGLISWLSFGLALLATDALLAGMISDAQRPPPSGAPANRRRGWVGRRLGRTRGTGWPVHFEGVTARAEDLAILDDMRRCADGDHSACVTDVRPRACVIGRPDSVSGRR